MRIFFSVYIKGPEYIFRGNHVLSPFEKGSSLKGKTLSPLGAKSFLLEQISFQKVIDVRESKQESSKVVSFVTKWRKTLRKHAHSNIY